MPAQSTARLETLRPEVLASLRAGRRVELYELIAPLSDEAREIADRARARMLPRELLSP